MRIAHLEAGRRLYGGARQAAYLIAGLARRGVDNVLICSRGGALARADLPAEVVELPLRGDLDVGQLPRIARVLRASAPDLLHVHSRRGADLYGGLSARRSRIPAVLTRRVVSAEPVFWGRLKFRAYSRVIAISTAVRAELCGRFGLDPAAVALVPSAVDTQAYRPSAAREHLRRTFGLPREAVVIGNVAQLIPRKGHDVLIRAFASLAASNPALYLICFGRGPLRHALERQVAGSNLADRVRFAGFRDDLADLLPGIDVLAHPAEREGLGVAVLEAMAAGVPVVAARTGGIPDAVEDGITGLLIPSGDAAAAAHAIERVLADPALRAALAERSRRRVEADFSIEHMVGANLAVYGEVLGGDGAIG